MALKFLADHCISNSIVKRLRDAGCEVLRLREVLPVESPDAAVIAKAQELSAILLSMNGDFADIVTYPPRKFMGIVAIQMRNHAEVLEELLVRLAEYVRGHADMENYRGRLLVVEVNRIRVRE